MEEQQNHLTQLMNQRKQLASELEQIQEQTGRKRELFLKTQGAIEYLEAVGVKLPESEVSEEVVEEVVEEPSSTSKRTKKA